MPPPAGIIYRYQAAQTMITGTELLTQVKDLQANGLTRDQILPELGYTNPENGKLLYTKFYEALIEAKGGPLFAPDVLPEDQAEYEKLCDQYGNEAVNAFVEQWSIDDIQYFENAYVGTYSSRSDFIDELLENVESSKVPIWLAIYYSETWHNLSYVYIYDEPTGVIFLKDW